MNSAITFRLEEDDLEAFERHFWHTSPHVQKRVKRMRLAIGILATALILGGAFEILLSGQDRSDGALSQAYFGWAFLVLGVIEAVVFIIFPAISLRSAVRQTMRFAKENEFARQYGERTLNIDGDQLEHIHPLGVTRYKIPDVPLPVSTDTHLYFMITPANAIVIPKQKVVRGDLDTLISEFSRAKDQAK